MSYFLFSINPTNNQMTISSYTPSYTSDYSSGLTFDSYNNNTAYFTQANSLSFFASTSKSDSGTVTYINFSNTDFNVLDTTYSKYNSNPYNFAIRFNGYFIPTSSGIWTFTITEDDSISFWVGTENQNLSTFLSTGVNLSNMNNVKTISQSVPTTFTSLSLNYTAGTSTTNGLYTVSASSYYNLFFQEKTHTVFNNSPSTNCWISAPNSGVYYNTAASGGTIGEYNTNSPNSTIISNYTTTSTTTSRGEWIQINLPYSVIINNYSLMPRYGFTPDGSFPTRWTIVGSNNGTTWYLIDTRTQAATTNFSTLQSFNITAPSNPYTYLRLIANALSGQAFVAISQWIINGYPSISSTYSVNLNSGSRYPLLLNYGQGVNNAKCQLGITPPSGTLTYDGTPYFFS